jgi:NAD(P)-dependent dehydrogenase (short-subunit alcohol dehydrogenase family)
VWDAILAVNLSAAFHTMQAALPEMARRGYGRVINIASVHGLVASVDKAPYVAAKHGLVGLSKVAALEYAAAGDPAKGGVTVNCICPGWTETTLVGPQIMARAQAVGGDRRRGSLRFCPRSSPRGGCRSRPRSGRWRSGSARRWRTTSPARDPDRRRLDGAVTLSPQSTGKYPRGSARGQKAPSLLRLPASGGTGQTAPSLPHIPSKSDPTR